jgi:anti-sigma factor RsiW
MGEASIFAKSVNYCMHHRGVMQVRREAMSYTQPQPALPMVSGNRWAMVLRGIAAVLFVGN